jgi:hypothetical protein
VEKVMRNICSAVLLSILTIGSIASIQAQTKSLTVTGTIVDSLSGAAIQNATILLTSSVSTNITTNDLKNLKIDTVNTNAKGAFSHTMKVSFSAKLLIYGLTKQDYQIKYSYMGILTGSVALQTVKLGKIKVLVNDTLTVSGTIVDSITGKGIAGAQVNVSGLGSFDTAGNTGVTGVDGTFSKLVITRNAASDHQLIFMVSKTSYGLTVGQLAISGKTLPIGKIYLRKSTGIIVLGPIIESRKAVLMGVYSLRGQLLCVGSSLLAYEKIHNRGDNMVIMLFRNNYGNVIARKAMELR